MLKTVLTVVLLLAVSLAVRAQTRTLAMNHFKDEPIEVVSVSLCGTTITPGEPFFATGDYAKDLTINIRNLSDQPVSMVSLALVVSGSSASDTVMNANYSFGARPSPTQPGTMLQPGATAVLMHEGTFGEVGTPKPARLLLTDVYFNSDDSYKWAGGRMRRKVEGSDPLTYTNEPEPQARYCLPREYQRTFVW